MINLCQAFFVVSCIYVQINYPANWQLVTFHVHACHFLSTIFFSINMRCDLGMC